MSNELCQNLQETFEHSYTGYLLGVLHSFAEEHNDAELQLISLREILSSREKLRVAVNFLFTSRPSFKIDVIENLCTRVETFIERGDTLIVPETIPSGPSTNYQTPIPANILNLADASVDPNYSTLINGVGFERESGDLTQHSRAFDNAILGVFTRLYINEAPGFGPREDCFELLRQTPCILTDLGNIVRDNFRGIQLVDVGAGTGEGIATWAKLFGAKACINIDTQYPDSSHLKDGKMDLYKLKGDALHVVSCLPEGIGSFHLSGMQLLPNYIHTFDGRPYLEALSREMYKKAPNGGLLFVGERHCSLSDEMVCKAGFRQIMLEPDISKSTEIPYRVYVKD